MKIVQGSRGQLYKLPTFFPGMPEIYRLSIKVGHRNGFGAEKTTGYGVDTSVRHPVRQASHFLQGWDLEGWLAGKKYARVIVSRGRIGKRQRRIF
jgi:hypothetical protein